jgi:hypothetical protein
LVTSSVFASDIASQECRGQMPVLRRVFVFVYALPRQPKVELVGDSSPRGRLHARLPIVNHLPSPLEAVEGGNQAAVLQRLAQQFVDGAKVPNRQGMTDARCVNQGDGASV